MLCSKNNGYKYRNALLFDLQICPWKKLQTDTHFAVLLNHINGYHSAIE
jgi:hypothetical protein